MDREEISKRLVDRGDCFYWQTDRKVSAEEAALIWQNRHALINSEELIEKINLELASDKISYIKPFDEEAETSFGNVNSNRAGVMESGKEVIIRCHPKGIRNGYFFVESLAAKIASDNGIPSYKTILIHELQSEDDVAFQVIEKLEGQAISFYLKEHVNEDEKLVYEMGLTMAKLHKIKVNGFGPFLNDEAKKGHLIGVHKSLSDFINAGLDENLERLVNYNILSFSVVDKIKKLFQENPLLECNEAFLIHNDFADWNLLTDGSKVTGVVDFDECVGGTPVQEIACWSTFFDTSRIKPFLEGYFSISKKDDNFDELFQLMRLRYTIAKMALRIKRYSYEKTSFLEDLIQKGEKHLEELFDIFSLND